MSDKFRREDRVQIIGDTSDRNLATVTGVDGSLVHVLWDGAGAPVFRANQIYLVHRPSDDHPRMRQVSIRESTCTEEVIRKGEYDTCDKPSVAMRIDPTEGSAYPVCSRHCRGEMVPLIKVQADAWDEGFTVSEESSPYRDNPYRGGNK